MNQRLPITYFFDCFQKDHEIKKVGFERAGVPFAPILFVKCSTLDFVKEAHLSLSADSLQCLA